MFFLLIFLSFLPVFLLGMYIYYKDTEKEPMSLLIMLFLLGFLSALIVIFCNYLIITFFPDYYLAGRYEKFGFFKLFLLIFLEMGLLEEFSKWILIRMVGFKNKEFDQLYDIIVYSVFVSLGFAFFENIFYVFQGGITTGIIRGIISVPGHAAFGVLMGYFLGYARVSSSKKYYYMFMFLSILIPSVLHTVFNFCLVMNTFQYFIFFIGFIILLYEVAFKRVDEFVSRDDKLID